MSKLLSQHDQSAFYDENGIIIHPNNIERRKQIDSYLIIPPDSIVLELGSHYGVVSCLINRTLKNPKKHLVIESNNQYFRTLIKNRDNNNCKFKIFNGHVSSLKDLESMYFLNFNVIIAECEESLLPLIQDDDFNKFKIIFLEREPTCNCEHQKVEEYLTKLGFICMRTIDSLYRSIYFNEKFLPFHIISHDTPHGNIGLFGKLGHMSDICDVITDGSELCTVSLHAPAKLTIETHRELIIKGYASPTSQICPYLSFQVDDQLIGCVCKAGSKMDGFRLLPGVHNLVINTDSMLWAHSVWLFEEPKNYEQVNQKYLKIDICHHKHGLINQFINLINGINLSDSAERYIHDPHFIYNYNSTDWIPLSTVFDINHLNQMITSMGLKTKIIIDESINNNEWIKPEYYSNVCRDKLSKEEHPYLDIGDIYSVPIEKDEFEFYKNMRFTSEFYTAVDYIQDNFLDKRYNVVHLRLEDDFISYYSDRFGHTYEEYTKILLKRYFQIMNKMFSSQDKIYIATHLLKSNYPNNYIIDLIREKYPNIITSIPWRDKINLPLGFRIDAIIDYLIAINSEKFIGIHGSDFSILINKFIKSKGKQVELVNFYAH